jgi:hypothetical protein
MDEREAEIRLKVLAERAAKNKAVTGRPKLNPVMEEELKASGQWDPESQPRRTLQNKLHALRARVAISEAEAPERFAWLMNKECILSELGRINDVDDLLGTALNMCDQKPNTRDAVVMIRHARNGFAPPPDADQLTGLIVATINAYIRSHPGVTADLIQIACLTAADGWNDEEVPVE